MAVGMPMLLLLEGWGTLVFNKFGCFLFRFFLCHEWFQKTRRQGAEWCPQKSFPQKTKTPKCGRFSQPRHFHAISLFLPWDFLCTSCCLTGCLVPLVPATGSDYSCRRDSWSVLWFLGEIEMNMMITNLLLHFFNSSFHSFTKFHKWVLSLKTRCCRVFTQDTAACGEKSRVLRSKFFPQRRVVPEIPKHISGLESEGDSFAEVMSMLFRPILIFPHLWPSWVLVVFSCIHFWNPEVYQANLVVWVFGPSAPPPL